MEQNGNAGQGSEKTEYDCYFKSMITIIMIKLMISIIKLMIMLITKTSQLAQNWSKSNPNYT